VTVLYTTYDSPSDPNFYDDNAFKAALRDLILSIRPAALLDIHGSYPYRPYEIDLGTMDGASVLGDGQLISQLVASLNAEGITDISYNRFPASMNQTITKFASSMGVPSVQLEFSSIRVSPSKKNAVSGHQFAQSLEALAEFLDNRGLCVRAKPARSTE
jgi:hypothetical protein